MSLYLVLQLWAYLMQHLEVRAFARIQKEKKSYASEWLI